jgi:thioredoxin reductase
MHKNEFEVIIIGGSYSGLSAAMALGRSLRKVLILDNGMPGNKNAVHSYNFLTQEGKSPKKILAIATDEVLRYKTVKLYTDFATACKKKDSHFLITTQSNKNFNAKKILFATGIKDILPDIIGFQECWGVSIIHCPYCHGYEFRNEETGILANGDAAFHYAQLLSGLTNKLTLFTNGRSTLNSLQTEKILNNKISIVEKEITHFKHTNGKLKALFFRDGSAVSLRVVYAGGTDFKQHSELPEKLGCEFTEQGLIKVDPSRQTNVKGIYACGDNSSIRSVSMAVATGSLAGICINNELAKDHF